MTNFDNELLIEASGQEFADWFYINKLGATHIKRIDYNTDPELQRKGWDVVITTPKYGEVVIQEKFHPNGTYDTMMVEIFDVDDEDGWALKLEDVDFVIDFSKDKIHIVNAFALWWVATQIKFYNKENSKIMKYEDFSFYTHKTWTTRYGRKYSSTCVKIPWRDMCACDIKTKVFDFGLSYPIK